MAKLKIALCDSDKLYCERFAAYVMRHKAKEIDLHVFWSCEQLDNAKQFDIILADDEMAQSFEQTNVLCLSEIGKEQILRKEMSSEKIISKYESMDCLFHEIYVRSGHEKKQTMQEAGNWPSVIGVCSPIGHEMQGFFSILYAACFGCDTKVLYLNFTEFSAFRQLYGKESGYDIGDLMIKIRSQTLETEYFWKCVQQMDDIFYVLPFENPENNWEITAEELKKLLLFVQQNTDFEMIVMDFGSCISSLAQILEQCSLVYLIGKEGYFYECRKIAFLEWLKKTGGDFLEEKIKEIFIPYSAKTIRMGSNVIAQLKWSEFGDFVRTCTKGDLKL